MTEPRILLWDIETSFNVAAVFKLFGEDYIDPNNLLSERYVICASWKWYGEDKVHSVSVLDDPKRFEKNHQDDTHVCKVLHSVLSQADAIVAHNGDNFDTKYAETRMLHHGLSALPSIPSIDTYKIAKNRFMFNSNKLDYIGKFLGIGRKIHTTPGLWLEVLRGSKAAVREMVTYNKGDVELLERVFKKLIPYIPNYLNRELFGKEGCPRCGSKKIQSRGFQRAITRIYRRFQCQSCLGWFRSTKAEKGTTKYRII